MHSVDLIFLNNIFQLLSEYLQTDRIVKPHVNLKDFTSDFESQKNLEYIKQQIEHYLKYCVNTSSPFFANQLFSGLDPVALAGEFVANVTNTSMATTETAEIATKMESDLVQMLINLVGYNEGCGIMCSGGSAANMLALISARHSIYPDAKKKGNNQINFSVFISEEAHYSFLKSAIAIGIGSDSIIKIKTDRKKTMDINDLEKKIHESLLLNRVPLCIVATSGTTVFGAFDNIVNIGNIAKKYNIWLHVDGSWGAPVMFSTVKKELMLGIELSDSCTWDFHKLLGCGLTSAFFISKHESILRDAISIQEGSEYIFHADNSLLLDTGSYSLQCGRRVDSLRVWLAWIYHGSDGFGSKINYLCEMAKMFHVELLSSKKFKILHEPEFLNICFQVLPFEGCRDQELINAFNLHLREKIMRDGEMMINYAKNNQGDIFFRMIFANHNITRDHVVRIIEILKNTLVD